MPVTITNLTKHTTTLSDSTKSGVSSPVNATKRTATLSDISRSSGSTLLDIAKTSIYITTESVFNLITETGDYLIAENSTSLVFTNAIKS